jgi:hypothetical protein
MKIAASLTLLVLLGLSVVSNANAVSDRKMRRTSEQIQTCVSEIGRHADYDNAVRVVHWVAAMEQRNLEGLEMKVETSVYLRSDGDVIREYRASCVTGTMGKIVKFRIEAVQSDTNEDR